MLTREDQRRPKRRHHPLFGLLHCTECTSMH